MYVTLQGQTGLFLLCVAMGGGMGLLYDGLRLFRQMLPHSRFLIQTEDGLYWIAVVFAVFQVLLHKNNGEMRFFILLGIFGGMGIYFLLVSHFVMAVGEGVLKAIKKLLLLFVTIILTPFRLLWLPFRRPVAKLKGYCGQKGKKGLQLCKVYVKIKKERLQRDIRFLRKR